MRKIEINVSARWGNLFFSSEFQISVKTLLAMYPLSLPQGNAKNVDFVRKCNSQRCTLGALWTQRERLLDIMFFPVSHPGNLDASCHPWLLSVTLCTQLIMSSSVSDISFCYRNILPVYSSSVWGAALAPAALIPWMVLTRGEVREPLVCK